MGPRGFRVSLTQTAAKEDYRQGTFNNHIVLSSMNIVLQLSELRLSTALLPRKGGLLPNVVYTGVCRWTGYGFGLCP